LYGVLSTSFGGGLIIGAALAAPLAQWLGVARAYWLMALTYGLLVVVYARLTHFIPALGLLFLQGSVNGVTEALMISLVLQMTPRNFVGRVLAVFTPMYAVAQMVATGLAGYMDSTVLHNFHATALGLTFGGIDTFFLVIGILAIAGGVYAWLTLHKSVLKLDKQELAQISPADAE
jgi:MFS family permease